MYATKHEIWEMYVKMVKSGARPCVLLEGNIYKWVMQDKVNIPQDLVLIKYDYWNPPWAFLTLKDNEERVSEIENNPEKSYLVGELLGFPYPISERKGNEKKFTLNAKENTVDKVYKIVYFVVPPEVTLKELVVWAKPIIDVLCEDYVLTLKLDEEELIYKSLFA